MTDIFEVYSEHYDAEVRLIILKALHDEANGRLSDSMLMHVFEAFAINRTRDYLRTQLNWLKTEGGAVVLRDAGTAMIAELTDKGEAHVQRRQLIQGVKRPSLPRG